MPKFNFECSDCKLEFERNLKTVAQSHECPNCQKTAPLVVSSFGFGFKQDLTKSPGNSGVHDLDYPTADKAVGRSAEVRWGVHAAREKVKAEARKQGGTRSLMRRMGDKHIDYEPMSDFGRNARKELTKEAIGLIQAQKENKKS